jgi:gamma-glutamylcyclotransferase (GGCT)/AIG2-like uncharacterized protein YtfP
MSEYPFLYGTLHPDRAPGELSTVIQRLEFVGAGQVAGLVYDFGEYPGAIPEPLSGEFIRGEVFRVPSGMTFNELDAYEEYDPSDLKGSLFVRRRVDVALDDGRRLPCWMYVYNKEPPNTPAVPGEDFRRVKAGSRQ